MDEPVDSAQDLEDPDRARSVAVNQYLLRASTLPDNENPVLQIAGATAQEVRSFPVEAIRAGLGR
jgi:hypothetical protein